jgi:hypothetical protein
MPAETLMVTTFWCDHADQQFNADASGLSPWWSSPGEKIDRLFVVMPQSRQTVMQMPNDGRQKYVLLLSAWPHFAVSGTGNTK